MAMIRVSIRRCVSRRVLSTASSTVSIHSYFFADLSTLSLSRFTRVVCNSAKCVQVVSASQMYLDKRVIARILISLRIVRHLISHCGRCAERQRDHSQHTYDPIPAHIPNERSKEQSVQFSTRKSNTRMYTPHSSPYVSLTLSVYIYSLIIVAQKRITHRAAI